MKKTGPRKALHLDEILGSLKTHDIGKKFVYLASTESTNLQASLLGKEGAPNGTVVLAERQTRGKGRLGRTWISPPFANLYFSILLRPPVTPQAAAWISLLAGLTVARSLRDATGLSPRIKWPNDILLNGKKLSGILTELHAEGNRIQYLVLGIGINVNMGRFPSGIAQTATSVKKELKHDLPREPLLVQLLTDLEKDLNHFYQKGSGTVSTEWKLLSDTIGRKVKILQPEGTLEGKAVDLDSCGGLILEKKDGSRISVLAGDVIHLRSDGDSDPCC